MGIVKHRPKIALLVRRELRPGSKHNGTVVIDARRDVPIEWLRTEVTGVETATLGSGKQARTKRLHLLRLVADLSGPRIVKKGRTELPFSFTLPPNLPPSYRGLRAQVEYLVDVRVSIPWWPDAKASFEIFVPRDEAIHGENGSLLFSSAPDGPQAEEPHIEGSLAASVFEAGGVVSGAFALSNVEWNQYRAVDCGLVGVESISFPDEGHSPAEAHRYEIRVPVDSPAEGESIPFRFRLPDMMTPTSSSKLWYLEWFFEARARVRLRSDLRLRVPVVVTPRLAEGTKPKRAYRAPPAVGSERIEQLWRALAEELDLSYDDGVLSQRHGDVGLEVWREHRGRTGVFIVSEVRYPSLHLDLDIRPARGLRRSIGGGVAFGDKNWDRKHIARSRDPEQARALGAALIDLLLQFHAVTMNDELARVEIRGAGQRAEELRDLCMTAQALAVELTLSSRVGTARNAVPPPAAMAEGLHDWKVLAARLEGSLETARMAITGELDGMRAEVRTEWLPEGEALRTLIRLEPTVALSTDSTAHLEPGADGASAVSNWAVKGKAARDIASSLLEDARALDVTEGDLRLSLGAPLIDPSPISGALEQMARLAMLLRPGSGPFR